MFAKQQLMSKCSVDPATILYCYIVLVPKIKQSPNRTPSLAKRPRHLQYLILPQNMLMS